MGRSFDNGRSEASSAVGALSTLQASLREHSKLCRKRTQSYAAKQSFTAQQIFAASVLKATLQEHSFSASVLERI